VTFSPDQRQLAFVRFYDDGTSALVRADVTGSNEQRLLLRPRSGSFTAAPAWSPDGRAIACAVYVPKDKVNTGVSVLVVNENGKAVKVSDSQSWREVAGITWARGGKGLIISAWKESSSFSQLVYLPYPSGNVRQITHDLHTYGSVSATKDGLGFVGVQSERLSALWVVPRDNLAAARRVTPESGRFYGVAWTRNNNLISL